jgi:ATP-dependent helicase IRC3
MGLRPYQQEAISAVVEAEAQGCINQLIALPCGTGKTRIASHLPAAIGLMSWEVMLFLVSGEQLCFQACEDLLDSNPNLRVTLEKAEHFGDVDADLIVASIDTLATSPDRLARLAALPIRIVFVDECHGAVSPKFMGVLAALRALKGEDNRDPSILHVGLTATPRRADGIALERVYDRITYRRTVREMVKEGWTAEPIAYRVDTGIDLDGVSVRNGQDGTDFSTGQLSRTVNTPETNALVVQKYLEYGAGLSAIGFTIDISHSDDLADTFRHHDLEFEAISSNTPARFRKELVEAHKRMELLGLTSCQALLTGFDSPPATVALWVRPTCSGLLYQQGVGRVGRPYPAPEARATHTGYVKANSIIIDFVGTSSRHRLYTAATLFGLNPQFDMGGRSIIKTLEEVEAIAEQNPTLDISAYAGLADVQAAATRVDLWKPAPIPKLAKTCSQFTWVQDGEDRYRLSAPGVDVFIEQTHLGSFDVHRRLAGAEPDMRMNLAEPEDCFAFADSLVPDEVATLIRANARWRKIDPTKPQCVCLWRADPMVKNQFGSGEQFYGFARQQFDKGNTAFSRGAISLRIDLVKKAKEAAKQKQALQKGA